VVDIENNPTFAKKFVISCVLHAGLILLAAMVGKVVGTIWKTNDIEVIRSSVRVDVVGMPKFTVQELKEMEKSAVVALPKEPEAVKSPDKVEAKPETEDVIKKDDLVIQEKGTKKKKSSFLSTLSDYAKVKVKKETKKGKQDGVANENLKALVIEGNRISQGSALTGDYSDEANSEFGAYVQTLPGAIRPYWKLPSHLLNRDLRCRIRIYLNTNGSLIKTDIVEPSGDPEFDARAEEAIRKTNFPPPSESVGKRLTTSGIILGFPL
jgi:TonB family protein